MINTKFYVHDEVLQRQGASGHQLSNFVRRQISPAEAGALDLGYGVELAKLDAEYPAIQKKFNELDAEVVKAAMGVNALLTARSPDLVAAQAALRMLASERDMGKRDYSIRRSDIFAKRQALTRPVVVDTLAEWRARRIALGENISIVEVEEVQHLFDKSEIRLKSNRRSLRRVVDFMLAKEADLRCLINIASLTEIIEFINLVEKKYSTLDPNVLEYEKMTAEEFRLLKEAEADGKSPVKAETAYFAKGETIRVKADETLLMDRFKVFKDRLK